MACTVEPFCSPVDLLTKSYCLQLDEVVRFGHGFTVRCGTWHDSLTAVSEHASGDLQQDARVAADHDE